jgi:hypothetical protein
MTPTGPAPAFLVSHDLVNIMERIHDARARMDPEGFRTRGQHRVADHPKLRLFLKFLEQAEDAIEASQIPLDDLEWDLHEQD